MIKKKIHIVVTEILWRVDTMTTYHYARQQWEWLKTKVTLLPRLQWCVSDLPTKDQMYNNPRIPPGTSALRSFVTFVIPPGGAPGSPLGEYVPSLFLTEAASSCAEQIAPDRKSDTGTAENTWWFFLFWNAPDSVFFFKLCGGRNKTVSQPDCNTVVSGGLKGKYCM